MPEERQPNPTVPPLVADAFVIHAQSHGIDFEFDVESLVARLESSLNSNLFSDENFQIDVASLNSRFDIVSGAAAFIGETLAREHDGVWTGFFASDAGTNFYTATVTFGDYLLHPICWLSYRLTNGAEEGTVADWIGRNLPSITARKDLTPQTGFIDDIF